MKQEGLQHADPKDNHKDVYPAKRFQSNHFIQLQRESIFMIRYIVNVKQHGLSPATLTLKKESETLLESVET